MSGRSDLVKGWCPGALRPMAARDGLLVRLRITGGIVPATTAHAIADLAERHGNGLFDLSARANLQMRGVREGELPALWEGLASLDLLDADAGGEAVRNVMCSPLAGYPPPRSGGGGPREAWWRGRPPFPSSAWTTSGEASSSKARQPPPPPAAVPLPRFTGEDTPDIRPLAEALEQALVSDPALHALPQKFGILLDDGGEPSLAGIAADLRYDWDGAAFQAGLGDTAADALDLGRVAANALVAHALAVAHRLLALPGLPRRPRALVESMGRAAFAAWFGAGAPRGHSRAVPPEVVGPRTVSGLPVLGLAAPFGRLDAAMLRAAAVASAGELRLTPWRTILLPGVDEAAVPGFITDPADPRLRVAACTGMAGCERGTTDTHGDAARLAPLAASLPGTGIALHVSGCVKGCARPEATAVTLVGHEGRYDVVRDGRPWEAPSDRDLNFVSVQAELRRLQRRGYSSAQRGKMHR